MVSLSVGVDLAHATNLVGSLGDQRRAGFDFVCVPLAHPRNVRAINTTPQPCARDAEGEPWTRSDVILDSNQWTTVVVGKLSPWLCLDSPSETIRVNSGRAFWQELLWATHLALPAMMLPPPSNTRHFAHYAHFINEVTLRVSTMNLWLRIPLCSPPRDDDADEQQDPEDDMWTLWNSIRVMCGHHTHLGCVLELGENLPSDEQLQRWAGEPVRAIMIPTTIFTTGKIGRPVLPPRHRQFLSSWMKLGSPQYILTGEPHHEGNGLLEYKNCLTALAHQLPQPSEADHFESPYHDYLQVPLQPLADNLESQTYETFERCPVKYAKYEEAMAAAMSDMSKQGRAMPLVLMVVGAGRGPLVSGAIAMSEKTQVPLRIYAIEKNPNALVTLRNKKTSQHWDNVTVVGTDMRVWNAPEKCDILVSELLGSFGDNELSPECLDGAQRFLKEDGVSIPHQYTSFIAPIGASKLHNEVKAIGTENSMWETPYVVKLHAINVIGGETKPCFTFNHPNRKPFIDNTRYTETTFHCESSCIVHGIAGYFQAMLYKDIFISINPATANKEMMSWFPIFFPLKDPVIVPANSDITVQFWRQTNSVKVWYEWCLTSPVATPVHNPNGRSYYCLL